MGFLDHSTNNIILDAVLTDVGRQFLSRNDGSFSIVKFAFIDSSTSKTPVRVGFKPIPGIVILESEWHTPAINQKADPLVSLGTLTSTELSSLFPVLIVRPFISKSPPIELSILSV